MSKLVGSHDSYELGCCFLLSQPPSFMTHWIYEILRRSRIAILALVCGFSASSLAAETNAELLEKIEDDTDRWIELKSALAKENALWKSEKELLKNSIQLLNTEKGIIANSLESNRLASELYVKNEASLREGIDKQEKALEFVAEELAGYREKVDSIISWLPDPIRGEVESLALKLKPVEGQQSATVAGRMQSLISLLTMIDQFNNSLTLTHQIRVGSNGQSFDTRVLYWGMSTGFAVNATGDLAWRLNPSANGWDWVDASSQSAAIKMLIDVYENDRRPGLVSLPAQLK